MSTAAAAGDVNAAYLGAALAWLRAMIEPHLPPAPAGGADPSRWRPAGPERPALPRADPADLRSRMDEIADHSPVPAAVELFDLFELSSFERDVLLLCAAAELDSGIGALIARVLGDPARRYPTVALAMTALPDPAWEAVSPAGRLRFWRLIDIDSYADPMPSRALRLDERIVNQLKGLRHLDDRLAASTELGEPLPGVPLPASQAAVRDRVVAAFRAAAPVGRLPVVQLVGPPESGRVVAAAVSAELGVELARVVADRLPRTAGELSELARLWSRELRLSPLALLIDGTGDRPEGDRSSVTGILDRLWGPVMITASESLAITGTWSLAFDVARPEPREQAAAWMSLAGLDQAGADAFAGHFDLELADIERVTIVAAGGGRPDGATPAEHLWDVCRTTSRQGLDHLAHRIDVRARWSELVLPRREIELLQLIATQATNRMQVYGEWGFGERMNRGLGVAALFAGGSGTGKTMAAEVIANHLRLDLYRIDLASVVSKWIGETAKILRDLFDRAEHSGAVLLFDEADAVFGKRTEVRDSHDRYANIDTSYLLQRLESYRGLAILTTNKRGAIDQAFLRRLRVVVTFPSPGVAERRRLWEQALPDAAPRDPRDPIDVDRLAAYELSGGAIHAAVLTGSFVAASDGGSVGMRHLVAGARNELLKLERPMAAVRGGGT